MSIQDAAEEAWTGGHHDNRQEQLHEILVWPDLNTLQRKWHLALAKRTEPKCGAGSADLCRIRARSVPQSDADNE